MRIIATTLLLAATSTSVPSFSPSFYGLSKIIASGPEVPDIEAAISVPQALQPQGTSQPPTQEATEYAWLMALTPNRRHFTQIGWQWSPGGQLTLFAYTGFPGNQWTEPWAQGDMAWSGRLYIGPPVHGSLLVRIAPVSGTAADARRWYADQVFVDGRWVTLQSYPLTRPLFYAASESYDNSFLKQVCFTFVTSDLGHRCFG